MRPLILLFLVIALPGVELRVVDGELDQLVARSATLERLGTDMRFTEGPVWSDADGGFLIFSDIPADLLMRWRDSDGVTAWRTPSGQANGNIRDAEGRLVSCEHATRRISRTAADGTITALVSMHAGKRLNSPNDAAVAGDGAIWFTDPPYGIAADQQEQPHQHVFRLDPASGALVAVIDDFVGPNGICFSPDGGLLYVADSGAPRHVRVFTVAGATLSGGRVFATIDNGIPDGIRCDVDGRLWVAAGDGIHVFTPDGRFLGAILVPESPANLCFGGVDRRRLFITARSSLYAIEVGVAGAR